MSQLDDRLFHELEPPPGGLQALRRRLDGERKSAPLFTRPRMALATAVLAGGLALGLWLFAPPPLETTDLTARFHPSLAAMGLVEAPSEPLRIAADQRHRMAARRVPLENDRVVLYLVDSLDTPQSDVEAAGEQ